MRGDFCLFIPFLLAQSRYFSFEILSEKGGNLKPNWSYKAQHSKGRARSKKRSDKSWLRSLLHKRQTKKHKRRQLDSIRQVAIPSMLLYNITKITTTPQTSK